MVIREYRALVVDDEPALRMLTIRELSRSGFTCDAAGNGQQARELAAVNHYDVVVTDLRMPEANGHTLAVELLSRENRPAVVVLTGVTEPRLARDLIARGVDDIMFKPVDQSILAAKVRALVDLRASRLVANKVAGPAPAMDDTDGARATVARKSLESLLVDPADLDAKLTHLATIVPISQAALEIVKMTSSDTINAQRLAATIELDASLAAELLRIANSTFYNAAGQKVVDLHEAVVRIGHKRIGELALTMSAMRAMTTGLLPWMNMSLIWRQSVAAGLATELLFARAGQSRTESGLFLSAIMHPLGRVVLGTLYPDQYQAMLPLSQDGPETLQGCEQRVFQGTHSDIFSRVLEIWKIPPAIFEPLKFIQHRSASVSKLTEPLRTKVELTQLAVLIGQIAVGQWEPWDHIDLPSSDAIRRLEIDSLGDLLRQLRNELQALGQQPNLATTGPLRAADAVSPEPAVRELDYCKLSAEPTDFLVEILPSMGVSVNICGPADLSPERPAVVNCLGVSAERVSRVLRPGSNHVLVTETADPPLQQFGRTVTLPQSYGMLRSACLKVAHNSAQRKSSSSSLEFSGLASMNPAGTNH